MKAVVGSRHFSTLTYADEREPAWRVETASLSVNCCARKSHLSGVALLAPSYGRFDTVSCSPDACSLLVHTIHSTLRQLFHCWPHITRSSGRPTYLSADLGFTAILSSLFFARYRQGRSQEFDSGGINFN